MKSCMNPQLTEAVLSAGRRGVLDQDETLHQHWLACPSCRAQLEQLQRMHGHWTTGPLTQAEILRLRLRLSSGAPSARSVRRSFVPVYAMAALLLCGGVAGATSYVLQRSLPEAKRVEQEGLVRLPDRSAAARPALPSAASSSAELTGEPLKVEPPAENEGLVDGASSAKPTRRSGGGPRAASDPRWKDAADALKAGNSPRAERAFQELSGSGDTRTRDSARLALCELWLEQGQESRARVELLRLSQQGATPLVRRRASELLGRVPASK